jgi:GNAT superfamily N-acetyltransferase
MSIHILGSNAEQSEVQKILNVSCAIFEIDPSLEPREAPADLSEWLIRLNEKSGEIIIHRDLSSGEVTAFLFTFRRSPDPDVLHIWIAGCSAQHRRKGIMNSLFEEVERRTLRQGYKKLTVNTYPEKFVNMPHFLNSRNYIVISTSPGTDAPDDLGVKLSFEKVI